MYPKAILVKPLPNYLLSVTFDNGEEGIFDVKPYIHGEWFGALSDYQLFSTVHVEGLSIAWDDGQDIAPDCLYVNSVKS